MAEAKLLATEILLAAPSLLVEGGGRAVPGVEREGGGVTASPLRPSIAAGAAVEVEVEVEAVAVAETETVAVAVAETVAGAGAGAVVEEDQAWWVARAKAAEARAEAAEGELRRWRACEAGSGEEARRGRVARQWGEGGETRVLLGAMVLETRAQLERRAAVAEATVEAAVDREAAAEEAAAEAAVRLALTPPLTLTRTPQQPYPQPRPKAQPLP
jgi:hypothetical protein